MRGRGIGLLLVLPLCVGWNGGGPGEGTWSSDQHGQGKSFDADAVVAVHSDTVQVVVVMPVPIGGGDGVLTLHIDPRFLGRDWVQVPHSVVTIRHREYASDGAVLFRGDGVRQGRVRLGGRLTGPMELEYDLIVVHDASVRRLTGRFDLLPNDWDVSRGEDGQGSDEDPLYYHEDTGCYGTYDEYDEDEGAESAWDSGDGGESGCGGDDLDDDGPSESSGCDGDNVGDDGGGDDSGCEGDNVDSSGDSGCSGDDGCAGDNVAAACARGRGPPRGRNRLARRAVGYLPWALVFLFLFAMRRVPRRYSQP